MPSVSAYIKKNAQAIIKTEGIDSTKLKQIQKSAKAAEDWFKENKDKDIYKVVDMTEVPFTVGERAYKVIRYNPLFELYGDPEYRIGIPYFSLTYIVGSKLVDGQRKELVHESWYNYKDVKVVKGRLECSSNESIEIR